MGGDIYKEFTKDWEGNFIFNKGIRIYLDKQVSKGECLSLPNWLGFSVKDGKYNYLVKIPLVHLILKNENKDLQKKALSEFISCNCEMYESQKWCKHIVSACYEATNYFKIQPKNYKEVEKKLNSTLDNIFNIENSRTEQRWVQDWNDFLSLQQSDLDGMILKNLENSSIQAFKNLSQNKNVLQDFKNSLKEQMVTWNGNKRAFKLFAFDRFFLIATDDWWNFWKDILIEFDPSFYPKIIAYLFHFKINYPELFTNFNVELDQLIKDFGIEEKENILNDYREYYIEEEIEIYDLAVEISFYDFVLENIEYYSPKQLILILRKLPDIRETTELTLARQVKTWVDFIKVGDYKDLINIIKNWRKEVGESKFLDSVVDYILQNHASKRSLIKSVKN